MTSQGDKTVSRITAVAFATALLAPVGVYYGVGVLQTGSWNPRIHYEMSEQRLERLDAEMRSERGCGLRGPERCPVFPYDY